MKELSKSIIIEKDLYNNIITEKKILTKIKSRFIVNMKCAFQDFSKLYLILELMQGGDLRYHLNHYQGNFTEKMIKMIIVNISLCLAVLHQNGIVHRDIKPENFLFDNDGYLHLTDFNSAVFIDEENYKKDILENYEFNLYDEEKIRINNIEKKLIGTLEYIAPEYILATENKITFASEFYSFGVICYELMFKQKPFIQKIRSLLGKEMLNGEINFDSKYKYSKPLKKLVKNLLAINPKERLGAVKGFNEIKTNYYMYDFNWEKFFEKEYKSPFADIIEQFKKNLNIDKDDDIELFDFTNNVKTFIFNEEEKMKLNLIESNKNFLGYFKDYNYIYFDKRDFEAIINGDDEAFRVKNNQERKIRRSGSSYSCSCSSCSCSCSEWCSYCYSKNKNKSIDDSFYFYEDKPKKLKPIPYLPIIQKEKKIIIPEIHTKIMKDAYKYKIMKYKKILKKFQISDIKFKKGKERLNNSVRYKNNKYILDKTKFNPNPLIFNNFYNPNNNRILLNQSSSLQNINPQVKNNLYFGLNFPPNLFKNMNYSSISSSETYDELFRKKESIKQSQSRINIKDSDKEKEKIKKTESKIKEGNKNQHQKEQKKIKDIKKIKNQKEESKSSSTNKNKISKKSNSKNESNDSEEKEESEESEESETTKKDKLNTIKENSDENKTSSG